MNTVNNKRKKSSQEKIESAFLEFIQTKSINEITVSDICKKTNLNRSTFYANYIDIYDLIDKIKDKMINDFFNIYKEESQSKRHSYDFLKLFYHIKDNQIFYKTYFRLDFDLTKSVQFIDEEEANKFLGYPDNIDYHVEFFKAGLNAIIKKWLDNNCDKSPEEIESILKHEYITKRIDL